jgi:Genetic competence transcription factor
VSTKQFEAEKCIVNGETMAILPFRKEHHLYAKILETSGERIVPIRPVYVIDQSCRYYGSSFKGRVEGSKGLLGITKKLPIVIDPANSLYFFPTHSPARHQCAWFSHSHISRFMKTDSNCTEVIFRNGQKIVADISPSSFSHQFYKTAHLRTIISSRIEQEQRRMNTILFPKEQHAYIYEQLVREFRKEDG